MKILTTIVCVLMLGFVYGQSGDMDCPPDATIEKYLVADGNVPDHIQVSQALEEIARSEPDLRVSYVLHTRCANADFPQEVDKSTVGMFLCFLIHNSGDTLCRQRVWVEDTGSMLGSMVVIWPQDIKVSLSEEVPIFSQLEPDNLLSKGFELKKVLPDIQNDFFDIYGFDFSDRWISEKLVIRTWEVTNWCEYDPQTDTKCVLSYAQAIEIE